LLDKNRKFDVSKAQHNLFRILQLNVQSVQNKDALDKFENFNNDPQDTYPSVQPCIIVRHCLNTPDGCT